MVFRLHYMRYTTLEPANRKQGPRREVRMAKFHLSVDPEGILFLHNSSFFPVNGLIVCLGRHAQKELNLLILPSVYSQGDRCSGDPGTFTCVCYTSKSICALKELKINYSLLTHRGKGFGQYHLFKKTGIQTIYFRQISVPNV